jgi:hypothetical protein
MPLNKLLNLDTRAETQDRSDEDLSLLDQNNDIRIIRERNQAMVDLNEVNIYLLYHSWIATSFQLNKCLATQATGSNSTSGGAHDVVETAIIEHVISIPEYPQRHDAGYAYVVNLQGLSHEQAYNTLTLVCTSRN